jgi:hypothetical protein
MIYMIRQLNGRSCGGTLKIYDFVHAYLKDINDDRYLSNIRNNGWRVSNKGTYMSFKLELIK